MSADDLNFAHQGDEIPEKTLEEHQADYEAALSVATPEQAEWLTREFEQFKAEYRILQADIDRLRVGNAALQARADRIKASRAGYGAPFLRIVEMTPGGVK